MALEKFTQADSSQNHWSCQPSRNSYTERMNDSGREREGEPERERDSEERGGEKEKGRATANQSEG